jgi:polysaccharide export outer membrane protein
MLNRFTYWMSAAAIMASAAGCAHHSKEVSEDQVQQMTEFRLSREDVVEVSVWKEGELSRTVPIRPDGKITLPLIGDVQAEGLKPSELEQNVQKALAPLVRDPHVSVIVHDVNGARVYVTGMVTHAGAFPLRSGMNVLQALALAGGLQEFADRGEIAVVREGRKISVDYDDLVNGKSRIALQAGDTVVVP